MSRVSSHDLPRLDAFPARAYVDVLSTMATQTELFDAAASPLTLVVRGLAGDAIALDTTAASTVAELACEYARRAGVSDDMAIALARGDARLDDRATLGACGLASGAELRALVLGEKAKPPERRRDVSNTATWLACDARARALGGRLPTLEQLRALDGRFDAPINTWVPVRDEAGPRGRDWGHLGSHVHKHGISHVRENGGYPRWAGGPDDQCMARVTVLRVGPCPDCCPDDCASAGESGSTQCGVYPPGSNQIFVCCGPFFCPCCSWRKNIVIVYDDEVVGVLGAETIQRESGDEECASRSSAPPPSPPSPPRSFSGANRSEAEAPLPPPDQPDAIASHPTEGPRVRFADEVLEAR